MNLHEGKWKLQVSPKRHYMLRYNLEDHNFHIHCRQKLRCPCFYLSPLSVISIHSNVTMISLRQISFPSKFLDQYFDSSYNFSLRAFRLARVKGKSVPLQAWSGPEGSRKLRFPDFMTTEQGGGKVVSHTHRLHLPPGNPPGTHFC